MPARPLLVGDIIRRNAGSVPRRAAASLGEREITHAELDAQSNRLAHALRGHGVGHGDRVLVWSDTRLELLPLFAACAKLGAVFAPLNARYGLDEATPVASCARPKLLVADAERSAAGEALAKGAGASLFARLGDAPGRGPGIDLGAEATRASADPVDVPGLRESDPHVLFFTSGSTGVPKGVVLSHRANFLRSFHGVFRDRPEISVCMFPLFHMAGFTLSLSAWQTGGEIALVENATAEQLLDAAERRRANRLYCIPAVWARLLEAQPETRDLSRLQAIDTGTSATPPELLEALKRLFPDAALRVYYGSTEAGAGTALADVDVLRKPGSVGMPVAGVELRVADDGEVQLRSPFAMDGYFENPEATEAAFAGDWYRSGDLGALDDEGYLSIVGRARDVIRSGGETIVPGDVEAAISEHPAVAEVAVVGLPDPKWGELVCAVVVLAAGTSLDLGTLQAHCEGRLAAFKKPRRLEFAQALPRTAATGQVQRVMLVERILAAPLAC